MKVLVVSNLYPPYFLGGYELLCQQVTSRFVGFGHECTVLTSEHGLDDNPLSGRQDGDDVGGVRVLRRLRLDPPFSRSGRISRIRRMLIGRYNANEMRELLAADRFDVVHVWSQLRLTLGASVTARSHNLPVVYSFNDEHIAGFLPGRLRARPGRLLRVLAERSILRDSTLAAIDLKYSTCISQCTKRRLLRAGVPIHGSRIIPQGIPIGDFPCKTEPGSLQQPVRILYAGQLHPYKGVHTLITAVQRAAANSDVSLAASVVGGGDPEYIQNLKAMSEKGNVSIHFQGPVRHDKIPRLMREHDVLVFPSRWEGEAFGLSHLEAMASGTTVIATGVGGLSEFIVADENALVFPPEDSEALAACIVRLTANLELSQRLAVNARQMVAERFTLDRYADELLEFLEECVKDARRSDRKSVPAC